MFSYSELKTFYTGNKLIVLILIFVVTYLIINWNLVSNGDYFNGQFVRPMLFTCIIFLILHMGLTWDDNNNNNNISENELVIPKYKLGQDNKIKNNEVLGTNTNFNNSFQPNQMELQTQPILNSQPIQQNQQIQPTQNLQSNQANQLNQPNQPNSLTNKYRIVNDSKFAQSIDNNKLSNQNIFISQKNSGKYGLKF